MPMRPPRACGRSTCPLAATHGSTYCAPCRARLGFTDKSPSGSHWQNWNRGTSTQRGYGMAWRRMRDHVMRRDGHLCASCKREGRFVIADDVHHIVPRSRGGGDNPANLEAICTSCHRTATATMRRQTSRGLERC